MSKYLNPKNDLTFKKVYGEHPDLLISLLNAFLPLPAGDAVTSIEYLTPELVPEIPTRKDSVVDVRCKDNNDRQFVVEMQMYWSDDFFQRSLFNTAKTYVKPLQRGEQYDSIPPVYSLNFVADIIYPDDENYYHHFYPMEEGNPNHFFEDFELVFIELPKFNPETKVECPMQRLWMRFLTEIDEGTRKAPAELKASEEIAKALELVEESAYTEGQMLTYDRYWDIIRRERSLYNKGINDGQKLERANRDAFWHDILRKQGYTDEQIASLQTGHGDTGHGDTGHGDRSR